MSKDQLPYYEDRQQEAFEDYENLVAERDRLSFELAEWKMRMTALVGEDAPDMAGNRIISLRAEKEGLERGILAMGAAIDALRAEVEARNEHVACITKTFENLIDQKSAEVEAWKMRMMTLVGEDSPDTAGNRIISLKSDLAAAVEALRKIAYETRQHLGVP